MALMRCLLKRCGSYRFYTQTFPDVVPPALEPYSMEAADNLGSRGRGVSKALTFKK